MVATDDLDDVVALAPDCVLYMQQGYDVDMLCTLLGSGINVVTTTGGFHHPGSMDADVRDRIEAACATGGASLHCHRDQPGIHLRGGAPSS